MVVRVSNVESPDRSIAWLRSSFNQIIHAPPMKRGQWNCDKAEIVSSRARTGLKWEKQRNREEVNGDGVGDQAGSKYRRTTFIFSALIIHLAPELVRLFLPRSQIKARAEMDAPRRNRDPTPASWNVQDQPWLLAGFGPPENRRRPRNLFSLNYPYFPRFYLPGNVARKDFSWVISSLQEVCLSYRRNALIGRTLFRYVQDY